ncbi:hypothetical protein HQ590_16105, partial [bacterium]|nr:hypothetical protein [bacterium]
VTAWAGDASGYGDLALWFWALAALAVPHLWLVMRDNRYGGRAALLLWVLTVCLPFGIGFSLSGPAAKAWPLLYTAYFATLYLGGNLWFGEGRTFGQRPLQTVGALGVIVLSIALTFEGVWEHLIEPASWLAVGHSPLALWPLASFALWGYTWTRRDPVALLVGALPVVVLIGSLLLAIPADPAVLVLMNLYVLGLGVALLGLGIRDHRLGVVNLGLLVTSALIVARFFDSDLGFVLRGLAFIAVGAGFLVTNIVLLRRARGGA